MNVSTTTLLRGAALGMLVGMLGVAAAPANAAQSTPALPQMGFNNWNSTHCRDEFNEDMIRGIADKFVSLGLKDAGYQYVNIDDCWANWQRDKDGHLQPNPKRFPSGIKALAAYIHSKGLKFGLYSSAGTSTCEPLKENRGFPGGLGHEKDDAKSFASWDVDYLKYDNCNNQKIDAKKRYAAMADALRESGREIFFSMCEWGENKPWLWAGKAPVEAGSWRTTGDITDTYASMLKIFKQNVVLDQYASMGHWNDPDMLEVGNGGMTDVEYQSHFSLWSIMNSPLLIGTDLRKIKPDALKILLNKDVIAVNQDPLGVQGKQVSDAGGIHVIVKPMKDGSHAVAVFNENDAAKDVNVTVADLGLKAGSYTMRDLWAHTDAKGDGSIKVNLAPHATVMYRISE
ncbi:glycoside hydrolase family 27 protein [Luteibacter aegosomatis]|uniref:glycoside hydrolase family 27 protein n=1 Tax=Luteibacter aegosomatis TaxID=2911537 RepID=UPI001FFB5F74|nr:glycoside hydrolase family 27 protein [Luteibacter aegosomatis]UPG85825.1 glycoside hydrolase family 27 protein [Luteibacter aegosomatis]